MRQTLRRTRLSLVPRAPARTPAQPTAAQEREAPPSGDVLTPTFLRDSYAATAFAEVLDRSLHAAGSVTLTDVFFNQHRDEVLALVHHVAARGREEHPLHRVMQIEEAPDGVVIMATDIHSPQRIAEALKHAYHGAFKLRYGHDEYAVRVNWRR